MSESKTPEERLDQLFLAAFGTNEAAMLDWVQIKFQLKEFRTKLQKMHRRAQRSESEANKLTHGVGTRAARYWQGEWSMVNARYKKARTDTERRTKRGAELEAYSAAVFPSSESNTPETSKAWAALLVVGFKYGFSEALLRSMAADMGAMEIQRDKANADVERLTKRVEELVSGHQGTAPPAVDIDPASVEILDPARKSNVGSDQVILLGSTHPEIVELMDKREWYTNTGGPCPCAPETQIHYLTRVEWQHDNYDLARNSEDAGARRWNHANGPGDILFWRPEGAPEKLPRPIKVKFVGRIDETKLKELALEARANIPKIIKAGETQT